MGKGQSEWAIGMADKGDLGVRANLLVDKHAEYIKSFTRLWETTDKIEFVATGDIPCCLSPPGVLHPLEPAWLHVW
jgi:hypothetical protein